MDLGGDFLGVKFAHLLAGVAGGVVRAVILKSKFIDGFFSALTGSLTAAYLTDPTFAFVTFISPALHTDRMEYASSFIVGLTAMSICEGLMKKARAWSKKPTFPGESQ